MGVLAAPVADQLDRECSCCFNGGCQRGGSGRCNGSCPGRSGERAVENNGNMDAAVGTPEQILTDAGVGAARVCSVAELDAWYQRQPEQRGG